VDDTYIICLYGKCIQQITLYWYLSTDNSRGELWAHWTMCDWSLAGNWHTSFYVLSVIAVIGNHDQSQQTRLYRFMFYTMQSIGKTLKDKWTPYYNNILSTIKSIFQYITL